MTDNLPLPEPTDTAPKRPYSPPVLTLYGDIREITMMVGQKGNQDSGPKNRQDQNTGI
jgi:hypothetical protein